MKTTTCKRRVEAPTDPLTSEPFAGTVAVKITDMLGEDVLVTREA